MSAARVVSTIQFWEAMCRPEFYRVNLHEGLLRGEPIVVVVAPEQIDGFIDSRVNRARRSLGFSP